MPSGVYRILLTGCLLVLLAGGAAHIFFGNSGGTDTLGVDDAYISYRYAHNLFRGNGLVFNPGERVEGYSNFSYVLLMSAAFFLTRGVGVYYFSAFLNLLFALVTLVVFASFLRERLGNWRAVVGAFLFALCLPVWAAAGSGMETCLILLIYVSIWVITERLAQQANQRLTAQLCALSVLSLLSRADGFLMPCAVVAYLLLKRRARAALTCAATLVASGFLYEAWRYRYYGCLLPNTYYIRVAGPLLWRARFALAQLHAVATRGGLLPYLLVFLLLAIEVARKWIRSRQFDMEPIGFEFFLAAGWIAYWLFIGGDYIGERFLLILFPLGIFGLLKLLGSSPDAMAVALVASMVALFGILPLHWFDSRFHFAVHRYDFQLAVGKLLRDCYPGKSLMIGALGKVPFLADSYTVDFYGLIDPVVSHGPPATREFDPGHVKFNLDYSLARKPDVIVEAFSAGGSLNPGPGWDLEERYEEAGYHISYLVSDGQTEPAAPIICTENMPTEAVQRYIGEGYTGAVIVRDDSRRM